MQIFSTVFKHRHLGYLNEQVASCLVFMSRPMELEPGLTWSLHADSHRVEVLGSDRHVSRLQIHIHITSG